MDIKLFDEILNVLTKLKYIKEPNCETYGITLEYAICKYNNIACQIKEKRINNEFVKMFIEQIENYDKNIQKGFKFRDIQEHEGFKNNSIDFITKTNKTVSIKTNTYGYYVSPQKIGQATKKNWCKFFNLSLTLDREIKLFIENNIKKVLKEYYNNLFCCDILVYWNKINPDKFVIYNKEELPNIDFENSNITFSHIIKRKLWLNSTTIKLNNISIGRFHFDNKRNVIHFKFNIKNLETIFLQEK